MSQSRELSATSTESKSANSDVADIFTTVAENSYAAITARLLQSKQTYDPIIATDPESAELVANTAALLNSIKEVGIGVAMVAAGAVIACIPKNGLAIPNQTTTFVDESSPDKAKQPRVKITGLPKLAPRERGLFLFTRKGETRDCETGELVENPDDNVNENRLSRPPLSGVDKASETFNHDAKLKPDTYNPATTTVGGLHVMSTGVSTAWSGIYSGGASAVTLLAKGAQEAASAVTRFRRT